MKVLFVAPCLPLEFGSGRAIRSYQLYTGLLKFAEVDVVTADNWSIGAEKLAEFSGNHLGHVKIPYYVSAVHGMQKLSPELQEIVDLDSYDYVFVRYYTPAFWLGLFHLDNLIVDCDDCTLEVLENEYKDNKRNPLLRAKSYLTHRFLKDKYLNALGMAKSVIYSRHSKYSKPLDNAHEIPNKLSPNVRSIDIVPSASNGKINVLFIGVLNYRPNVDGLNHFLNNIWSEIVQSHPDAELTIVGSNAKPRNHKRWATYKNVNMLGYVRDIEEAYANADMCVVPVYRGGGVHIKIMEAFKYHTPVVMSLESQRGYGGTIEDGKSAFIARNDEEFIAKLARLIDDSELREAMANHGNEVFHQSFSIAADDPTLKNIVTGTA